MSAASVFEITTSHRLGKLPSVAAMASEPLGHIRNQDFESLPIGSDHAHGAGVLAGIHRDPFDRLLIAQIMIEDVPPVSDETLFDAYVCPRFC